MGGKNQYCHQYRSNQKHECKVYQYLGVESGVQKSVGGDKGLAYI